ncbi:hypothetical protein ACFV4P_22680 [Kitasatospora sp. NPDC059795]|uniref:hypothetical protein n=1 Tax=Kitasatospora sp. NPDC059795 TaxID=3346949 RepID=UPI00365AC713
MEHKPVEVRTADGSFGVLDAGAIQGDPADYSNGLIITMPTGARIHTGIDTGPVLVTATGSDRRPDSPADTDSWDEIIEASVHAPRGILRVEALEKGPVPELPVLSLAGPGWYRLLVQARGRDSAPDTVAYHPVEEYVITVWPEPPSPLHLLKTSDECGRSFRLAASRRHQHPAAPAADTDTDTEEVDQQLAKRRARLQAMGASQSPE